MIPYYCFTWYKNVFTKNWHRSSFIFWGLVHSSSVFSVYIVHFPERQCSRINSFHNSNYIVSSLRCDEYFIKNYHTYNCLQSILIKFTININHFHNVIAFSDKRKETRKNIKCKHLFYMLTISLKSNKNHIIVVLWHILYNVWSKEAGKTAIRTAFLNLWHLNFRYYSYIFPIQAGLITKVSLLKQSYQSFGCSPNVMFVIC